ncbi:glycosyltransferase [Entomomonas moraniae]|uniref:Glycosyltransferase n=1 Tax=Entomomonas moraniae TaxID=2213226 RepID=A0A3Q9JHG2_9GAMM|nr:glycosyltransferase family 2 protein [Entomomonas moraniae]AZS49637.1 glycosyltransferase [Entomomonas moraniae]
MNLPQTNLITFCCLGYNHSKFLKECLDSIVNIGYENVEVVVVDDGSKDNSVELLEEIKKDFPYPLEIIAQANTGKIGWNINNAIRKAKGQLISFTSLDDTFNADAMRTEINEMNANPDMGFIASTKAIFIDDKGMVDTSRLDLVSHELNNPTIDDLLELEYREFGAFYIQGSVIRKDIINAIGGYDEDMIGDDIILRTKIFKYMQRHPELTFKVIKEGNVFYRMHETNIHKNLTRQIETVIEYLDRYWPERPNPEILINWMNYTIGKQSFEEYMPLFAINERAASLLKEQRIQQKIKSNIIKNETTFFQRFIFNKRKKQRKTRVTLLGFIKFSYQRAKKEKRKQQQSVHYTQYK